MVSWAQEKLLPGEPPHEEVPQAPPGPHSKVRHRPREWVPGMAHLSQWLGSLLSQKPALHGDQKAVSPQLWSPSPRPLTSKVTGGMRERRWEASGPSCSKALTCGWKCMGAFRLGGEGKAAWLGQSQGEAWAFSEPRRDRSEAQGGYGTPHLHPHPHPHVRYLIFDRGQEARQLAELGHRVDRIGLARHLGQEEKGG